MRPRLLRSSRSIVLALLAMFAQRETRAQGLLTGDEIPAATKQIKNHPRESNWCHQARGRRQARLSSSPTSSEPSTLAFVDELGITLYNSSAMCQTSQSTSLLSINEPPGFCQYAGGPCDQSFANQQSADAFFVYPSQQEIIATTVDSG